MQGLLRGTTQGHRRAAVERLISWQGAELDPESARAALRAAAVVYPWVPGASEDIGELFVRLLWNDPTSVDIADLERAYMACAERGRRAVMRTMALRADSVGLQAVGHLLGPDGPRGMLPTPGEAMLAPLLEVRGVAELAPKLVSISMRPGWSHHAAELLGDMAQRGLLGEADDQEVATSLLEVIEALVATCDRNSPPRILGTRTRADTSLIDPARVDRRRLLDLLPLLVHLTAASASVALRRALASADPRVCATAAVGLVCRGVAVGEDRLDLLCRDALARAVLFEGLTSAGRAFQLPTGALDPRAVAEALLAEWFVSPSQLRCVPDELVHRCVVSAPRSWGPGTLHVFAFRVNAPHWVAERDWMIAAVGPFDPTSELIPSPAEGFAVHSLYEPEASMANSDHVAEISRSLCETRQNPLA